MKKIKVGATTLAGLLLVSSLVLPVSAKNDAKTTNQPTTGITTNSVVQPLYYGHAYTTTYVNIRSGPGTSYPSEGVLDPDECVKITSGGYGSDGYYWYKCTVEDYPYYGTEGYIRSDLLYNFTNN